MSLLLIEDFKNSRVCPQFGNWCSKSESDSEGHVRSMSVGVVSHFAVCSMGVANGINLVNGVSFAVVDGPLFKIPHCFRPLSTKLGEEGKGAA